MILKLIDAMEQKLEKLISISSNVLPHVARNALPDEYSTFISAELQLRNILIMN